MPLRRRRFPPKSLRDAASLALLTLVAQTLWAAGCSDDAGEVDSSPGPDAGAELDSLDLDAGSGDVDASGGDPLESDATDGDAGADGDSVDDTHADTHADTARDVDALAEDGADTPADTEADAAADAGDEHDGSPLPLELFGAPLSTDAPPLATTSHPLAPSVRWADPAAPLPTSTWWELLAIGTGESPVNVYPYVVRALPNRLLVSPPVLTASAQLVSTGVSDLLALSAVVTPGTRRITAFDDLSVTLAWSAGAGSMRVALVRGAPYVTVVYEAARPLIQTALPLTLDGAGGPGTSTVTAARVAFALDGQRWVVYASESLEWAVSASELRAAEPFDGTIRVALVGAGDRAEALLDAHAATFPTGGSVTATAQDDLATVQFEWAVTRDAGDAPLLAMALPHHLATLDTPVDDGLTYDTLSGPLTAVIGDSWTFQEPLPTIAWEAPAGIAADRRDAVEAALVRDAGLTPVATDPYFFGKQVAAVARLALIADELGRTDLAASLRTRLRAELAPWVDGTRADPLVYDQTWGGVVVESGLANPSVFFGQGYYNDHHFHYGYFVYAAAALARDDADWAAENGEWVLALVRDVANPSREDPYFPPFRHMDWYAGHSWASGLFDFPRTQESTSEAVNAYYAVSLWGRATADPRLADLGRLAAAIEIRAAQTYWQIDADDDIYPAPFGERGVVGILWDLRAEYAVFFGPNEEYLFGIQALPFTPISEALLDPAWIAEVYPTDITALLQRNTPPVTPGWRGFMYMLHAVDDPTAAWTEVQTLTGYDDGNTETNTLYWVATRPSP